MKNLSHLFIFFFLTAATAAAQVDFNQKVSPSAAITYLDLVRKVFPDAAIDSQDEGKLTAANKTPPLLRRILPTDKRGISEKLKLTGKVSLSLTDEVETVNDREKILWLIIGAAVADDKQKDSTDEYSILAAFRIREKTAELIDAAHIKNDSVTSFTESSLFDSSQSKFAVAPGREAVFIYNYDSVSLGTDSFAMIDIDKNRFRMVFKEFYLERDERCDAFFDDRAQIRLLKESRQGYRNIEVIVTTEKGFGRIISERKSFRYLFAWDPGTRNYRALVNPDKQRKKLRKSGGCGGS